MKTYDNIQKNVIGLGDNHTTALVVCLVIIISINTIK